MQDTTQSKIKELMLSQINPLLAKRVNIGVLQANVRRKQEALNDAKESLAKEQQTAEEEFKSLIDLIVMSGLTIRATDSNAQLMRLLHVEQVDGSLGDAAQLVRDIANRMEELVNDGS